MLIFLKSTIIKKKTLYFASDNTTPFDTYSVFSNLTVGDNGGFIGGPVIGGPVIAGGVAGIGGIGYSSYPGSVIGGGIGAIGGGVIGGGND